MPDPLVLIAGAVFSAALGWLAYELVTAPFGYEDSEAFHFGEQPLDDDSYLAWLAQTALDFDETHDPRSE
jgi:hypothetical protein